MAAHQRRRRASGQAIGDVGKGPHRAFESLDVLNGSIDEKVDIFRGPDEAVENDRKAADQNVPNARFVQRFAECEEVFELRCA